MERVFEVAASITPLDTAATEQARARQLQLTKPPGSLGRLEEIAVQMAGITRQPLPEVKRKAVIVMAADHGVAVEGVSAYPSAVTPQMVLNFLHGGAAINALARHAGSWNRQHGQWSGNDKRASPGSHLGRYGCAEIAGGAGH